MSRTGGVPERERRKHGHLALFVAGSDAHQVSERLGVGKREVTCGLERMAHHEVFPAGAVGVHVRAADRHFELIPRPELDGPAVEPGGGVPGLDHESLDVVAVDVGEGFPSAWFEHSSQLEGPVLVPGSLDDPKDRACPRIVESVSSAQHSRPPYFDGGAYRQHHSLRENFG
jgi:hypothetical protein